MKTRSLAICMTTVLASQFVFAAEGEDPSTPKPEEVIDEAIKQNQDDAIRKIMEIILLEQIKDSIRRGDVSSVENNVAKDADEDESDPDQDDKQDSDSDYVDEPNSSDSDADEGGENNEGSTPETQPTTPKPSTALSPVPPPVSWEIILSEPKSKKPRLVEKDNHEGLSLENDWIGVVPTKISHLLEFYRDEERFTRLGAKMPKAFLFIGPPGVGKTYLAKILSSELDYPLTYVTGPSLKSKWVGGSKDNIKKIFGEARKKAKDHKRAMIFIDELDAVGSRDEETGNKMATSELINQLLAEIDGFHESNILLFGASNHLKSIDTALLRSGRFDAVHFDLPDEKTRIELFKFYSKKLLVDDQADVEHYFATTLLKETQGFSSADFKSFCNQAALCAGFDHSDFVTAEHFKAAIELVKSRNNKKAEVPEFYRHMFL